MVVSKEFLMFTESNARVQVGAFNTLVEDLSFFVFKEYKTLDCLKLVQDASKLSVARMIVDARFPTETQQNAFADKIKRYTQALKLAFRGMINQVGLIGWTSGLIFVF